MQYLVNNSAAPNLTALGTLRPPNAGTVGAGRSPIVSPTPPVPEPAAVLNISASGLELLATLQISSSGDDNLILKIDDDFWETRAQSKELRAIQLPEVPERIGALEQFVLTALANTTMDTETAKKFASELSYLIIGTDDAFGDPAESLAERVVNRENGLALAEYIAENYIDEPDARQAFLDGVKQFANSAVERDLNPQSFISFRHVRDQNRIFIPGYKEAYNAAFRSIAKTLPGDDDNALRRAMGEIVQRGDVEHKAIEILLHDPKLQGDHPKYKEIADRYDAGEISDGMALIYMYQIANCGMIEGEGDFNLAQKPTSTYYDEPASEVVAHAIEQIRKTLDVDAIKEDVMNKFREILFSTPSSGSTTTPNFTLTGASTAASA